MRVCAWMNAIFKATNVTRCYRISLFPIIFHPLFEFSTSTPPPTGRIILQGARLHDCDFGAGFPVGFGVGQWMDIPWGAPDGRWVERGWCFAYPLADPTSSMALTYSWPETTSPKTVCLPSRWGVETVVMKNWEPLL